MTYSSPAPSPHQVRCTVWINGGYGGMYTTERVRLNPDRHARIRAKHFTYAAELWDCEALDPGRRPFDIEEHFDWQAAMMDHDRAHGYFEAARNSAWGVS